MKYWENKKSSVPIIHEYMELANIFVVDFDALLKCCMLDWLVPFSDWFQSIILLDNYKFHQKSRPFFLTIQIGPAEPKFCEFLVW